MKRVAFAALFLMTGQAMAADCKSAQNTIEINVCASDELKASDAKLNDTYRRVLESLAGPDNEAEGDFPASTKASLVEAQRAWVKFRDANCAAVYKHWQGGTIRTVMELTCRQELTEERTRQLEREFLEQH